MRSLESNSVWQNPPPARAWAVSTIDEARLRFFAECVMTAAVQIISLGSWKDSISLKPQARVFLCRFLSYVN
jgi:hypothetical protein